MPPDDNKNNVPKRIAPRVEREPDRAVSWWFPFVVKKTNCERFSGFCFTTSVAANRTWPVKSKPVIGAFTILPAKNSTKNESAPHSVYDCIEGVCGGRVVHFPLWPDAVRRLGGVRLGTFHHKHQGRKLVAFAL
jgi:hypothetical protein